MLDYSSELDGFKMDLAWIWDGFRMVSWDLFRMDLWDLGWIYDQEPSNNHVRTGGYSEKM